MSSGQPCAPTPTRRGRGSLVGATAGAVVLLIVAAACSTSGGESASTAASVPAASISEDAACTLVTAADATAVFGMEAMPTAADQPDGVVSQCIYESVAPANGQLLQFRIFDGTSYYSRELAQGAVSIDGLGDEAYVDDEGPTGIVDLQFVDDEYTYTFAYSNSSGDAAAKAPAVETLAREASSER